MHLRRRTKRRVPERVKDPIVLPIGPNITWSMDFMVDRLLNGNKLRTFNVIDDFGREALNITIDTSIRAHCVTRELDKLIDWRGKPERLRVDNGPEFIAQELELWAERNDIALTYIEKGKPMQNALIERFNRTWREEVLDACLFEILDQLREFVRFERERRIDATVGALEGHVFLDYRGAQRDAGHGRADTECVIRQPDLAAKHRSQVRDGGEVG